MQFEEQNAFVLHTRPYREHQVLVELLTEHDGKVAATTYVSKSGKTNKKGLLQPFLPLKVLLKGRHSLRNLSRIESTTTSFSLVGNHLYSGFYLNELFVRLLGENIPCPELYQQYNTSLTQLAQKQPIEPILRQFELSLLDELGLCFDYEPVFQIEASSFTYLPEQGFIPLYGVQAKKGFLREHLQAIAREEINTPEVLRCFKGLMRQTLNQMLGNKPLNSRKLFKK